MQAKLTDFFSKDNFTKFFMAMIDFVLADFLIQQIFISPYSPVTRLSVFLPPVLGLMWGLPAALGIVAANYVSLIVSPIPVSDVLFIRESIFLFMLAYIPRKLWYRILLPKNGEPLFSLRPSTLLKFVVILVITTTISTIFFGVTVPRSEIDRFCMLAGKQYSTVDYILIRFVNDMVFSLHASTFAFFVLIGVGFPFDSSGEKYEGMVVPTSAMIKSANYRELVALILMLSLFFMLLYFVMIYSGMIRNITSIRTWEIFITRILTLMDAVYIGFLALLLKYKNSIMLEMIMLSVAMVFSSSIILGIIGIIMVENILDKNSRQDLKQIGIIQTEHLSRVFDNVEVSVRNMQDFATREIQDYDRMIYDEAYRKEYVKRLAKACGIVAQNTVGITDYYMHFNHELINGEDGFYWLKDDASKINGKSVFIDTPVTPVGDFDKSEVEYVGWYYIPIETGKATWTPPYFNLNSKVFMISYVIPMYHHGELFGIIGMDIDVKYIIAEIQRMSIYSHGFAYLVDSKNRAIYHKDYQIGAFVAPDPNLRVIEMDVRNGMMLAIANSLDEIEQDRNDLVIRLLLATLIVAVILSLVSIKVSSGIVRPLLQVNEAAKKIAEGHLKIALNYESHNEIGSMVRSIHEMVEKLDGYMYRDQMTGMKNNAAYIVAVKEIEDKIMHGEELQFGVVVLDVNSLKYVNDNYGHDAGNDLIRRGVNMICSVFRNSTVYRTGGDEFIIILEGEDYSNREDLSRIFDRLVRSEMIKLGDEMFHVSIAYGIGIFEPGKDSTYKDIFKRADAAMYVNKETIKRELNLPSR